MDHLHNRKHTLAKVFPPEILNAKPIYTKPKSNPKSKVTKIKSATQIINPNHKLTTKPQSAIKHTTSFQNPEMHREQKFPKLAKLHRIQSYIKPNPAN